MATDKPAIPNPLPGAMPAGMSRPTGGAPGANPYLRQAVALSYRPEDEAPRVTAQGRGLVAEEIIRRANEAGV